MKFRNPPPKASAIFAKTVESRLKDFSISIKGKRQSEIDALKIVAKDEILAEADKVLVEFNLAGIANLAAITALTQEDPATAIAKVLKEQYANAALAANAAAAADAAVAKVAAAGIKAAVIAAAALANADADSVNVAAIAAAAAIPDEPAAAKAAANSLRAISAAAAAVGGAGVDAVRDAIGAAADAFAVPHVAAPVHGALGPRAAGVADIPALLTDLSHADVQDAINKSVAIADAIKFLKTESNTLSTSLDSILEQVETSGKPPVGCGMKVLSYIVPVAKAIATVAIAASAGIAACAALGAAGAPVSVAGIITTLSNLSVVGASLGTTMAGAGQIFASSTIASGMSAWMGYGLSATAAIAAPYVAKAGLAIPSDIISAAREATRMLGLTIDPEVKKSREYAASLDKGVKAFESRLRAVDQARNLP